MFKLREELINQERNHMPRSKTVGYTGHQIVIVDERKRYTNLDAEAEHQRILEETLSSSGSTLTMDTTTTYTTATSSSSVKSNNNNKGKKQNNLQQIRERQIRQRKKRIAASENRSAKNPNGSVYNCQVRKHAPRTTAQKIEAFNTIQSHLHPPPQPHPQLQPPPQSHLQTTHLPPQLPPTKSSSTGLQRQPKRRGGGDIRKQLVDTLVRSNNKNTQQSNKAHPSSQNKNGWFRIGMSKQA